MHYIPHGYLKYICSKTLYFLINVKICFVHNCLCEASQMIWGTFCVF